MRDSARPSRLLPVVAALLIVLVPPAVRAQDPWTATVEQAQARRDAERVPIVYYLYTSDASPREQALAPLWSDPEVAGRLARLAAVRLSIRTSPGTAVAQEQRIARVPSLVAVAADGTPIGRLERDEITRAGLLALLDQALRVAPVVVTPAPTPAPVTFATPAPTTLVAPGSDPTGARQMIVGWCLLESIEADGSGRGTYQNRPILVRGMPPTTPGQWIYFSDLGDRGSHLEGRFAPAPTILTDPPVDPASGKPIFEVGMWFDCTVLEPARRDPKDGVTRLRGKVTFIPDTQPGDRVVIEITDVSERFNASRVMYRYPRPTPTPTPAM